MYDTGSMFNVIAALVKGLYLTVKRRFIDIGGVDFVVQLLKTETDMSIRKKALSVIDDFVMYDKDLGSPETLLMVEQDREILKGKASAHIPLKGSKEKTAEEKATEDEPMNIQDHTEYLHITKKSLFNSSFLDDLSSQLASVDQFRKSNDQDAQSSYFKIAKLVLLYGKANKLEVSSSLKVV